jgi:hypothetical protein
MCLIKDKQINELERFVDEIRPQINANLSKSTNTINVSRNRRNEQKPANKSDQTMMSRALSDESFLL